MNKLLQTELGIKVTGMRDTYVTDTVNLLKPVHQYKSVLDELINFFLSILYIIYKNII